MGAIIEKYYGKMTKDFHFNKRIIDDIAVIQSKRMRNKIAGYTTHLMKRIEKGPVRYLTQTSRGRKRKKDGFHPRKIRDPNLQHRHPRCRRQGPHQRPWYQEPCQPTQPKKGRKKLKLRGFNPENRSESVLNLQAQV